MTAPTAPRPTVVVVSRHRPRALALCLRALTLQDHPAFEIVLVADPASVGARPDLALRRVAFDEPDVSAARNAGIAAAGGDVVAFIDDDAVAEPTWLSRLVAPFADPRVLAATGFTRGRDGVRWQCGAERIGTGGVAVPVAVPGDDVSLLRPEATGPVSTLGTNCAFRRDALGAIGGFDPAFPYFLDESDVNLRMAARFPDALTAVVPGAQVIHGWAGDGRRHDGGVPRDLRVVGQSLARFCARHGGDPAAGVAVQRRRLLRLMVGGQIDPARVGPLMAGLRAGMAGATGAPPVPRPTGDTLAPDFVPLAGTGARPVTVMSGWHWQARGLRARARDAAAQGHIVTLILLTPTILPHRARFVPGGWWEQLGGTWGPRAPDDPAAHNGRCVTRDRRAAAETARIARVRNPVARAGAKGDAAVRQGLATLWGTA